ncbi:band 7 protein [Coprobacillus sp. CAG:826]|nr:band 7 protein [Coprobacillus sp. CAG:826]
MIQNILLILFLLVVITSFSLLVYSVSKKKSKEKNAKNKKIAQISTISLCVSFICTFLIPSSFHQVEAGQVAVMKSLGKIVGTRMPGTYFDFCLTSKYIYFDTTVQKLDINTNSYSSDAQTMNIQMTVQYRIDPSKAENILTEYSNMSSLAQRIEKVADDNVKSILSKYTAMKIIETRSMISPEVEQTIKEAVGNRYYVQVTAVNLTNIDFTDEFEKAVEDKVVAEQQKEAAITKAEQELEVAKLTAQAKIEAARGDAESQKIIASASAEAMALKIVELAKSLGFTVNETYIQNIETLFEMVETGEKISSQNEETEVTSSPITGVMISYENEGTIRKTITTSLVSTQYSIVYDESHTKEDLKVIVDFVKYLEYLEKWDGKLPEVMTGTDGVDIIIPSDSNPSTGV